MDRRRLILVGMVALLLATFVSSIVYNVLRKSMASAGADTPVVIASTDLPPGKQIEPQELRLVKLPVAAIPKEAFHNIADVAGRGVIVGMAENEMVLSTKVAEPGAGAGVPARIPQGLRAVSVKANEVVSVAGFSKPGTRVDVLLTGNPNRDSDPSKITTTTVLENVAVLCAGKECQDKADNKPLDVNVVTLLVNPEDAQKLTLASLQGRIQLALRNPLDRQETNPPVLLSGALYRLQPAAAPSGRGTGKRQTAPPPPKVYVVEMIRGDKRDVTKF